MGSAVRARLKSMYVVLPGLSVVTTAPRRLTAFPDAVRDKSKSSVTGGAVCVNAGKTVKAVFMSGTLKMAGLSYTTSKESIWESSTLTQESGPRTPSLAEQLQSNLGENHASMHHRFFIGRQR